MKSWHKFAILVWNYPDEATMPPKKTQHVISYVSIFSNSGTAANYVGFIKRGCIVNNYALCWYTEEVPMAMRGLKKSCLKWFGGPKRTEYLMTTHWVSMVTTYNDFKFNDTFSKSLELAWIFLLRLKSEGLIVRKGEESDLGRLPFDRDNSVWVDQQKTLHFKMRKRKNKPWGSHLQAKCQCHKTPLECIPCKFYKWLKNFEVGQVIWRYKPAQYQEVMRR